MRFPNLRWALSERRISHWQFALRIPMEPSTFSRRMNGRGEFTPLERERIAHMLSYPAGWLFQIMVPPTAKFGCSSGEAEKVPSAIRRDKTSTHGKAPEGQP